MADNAIFTQKQKTWEAIEADFNSVAGRLKRSVGQLKTLWRGLKAKSKEEVGDVKRARRETGGGPPPDDSLSVHD